MSLRLWLSIAIAACVLFATSSGIVAVGIEGRIVGGADAHVTSFPYQVSIRRKICATCAFEQFASGAVYSENIILTSANAIRTETAQTLMVVASTSYRTASDGMVFPVESIITHEAFDSLTLNYDIALLKLKVDLPLGEITVRSLQIAEALPEVGSVGLVAGWGQTSETGDYSETIQQARLPIVSTDSCQKSYEFSKITENMICAGMEQGGSDACKGDGGSPLVVSNELVGLVSWGVGCARPNNPGVYTNLVQLRAWIENTVKDI